MGKKKRQGIRNINLQVLRTETVPESKKYPEIFFLSDATIFNFA